MRIKERQVEALRRKRAVPKDVFNAVRCNVANVFRNALLEVAGPQTVEEVRMQIHDGLEELISERVILAGTCTNVRIEDHTVKADIHIVPSLTLNTLVFNCVSHHEGLRIEP